MSDPSTQETEALIDRMRKASRAVYMATDAAVADDLSEMLVKIEALYAWADRDYDKGTVVAEAPSTSTAGIVSLADRRSARVVEATHKEGGS